MYRVTTEQVQATEIQAGDFIRMMGTVITVLARADKRQIEYRPDWNAGTDRLTLTVKATDYLTINLRPVDVVPTRKYEVERQQSPGCTVGFAIRVLSIDGDSVVGANGQGEVVTVPRSEITREIPDVDWLPGNRLDVRRNNRSVVTDIERAYKLDGCQWLQVQNVKGNRARYWLVKSDGQWYRASQGHRVPDGKRSRCVVSRHRW